MLCHMCVEVPTVREVHEVVEQKQETVKFSSECRCHFKRSETLNVNALAFLCRLLLVLNLHW